jgi:hypothetical protein
MVDTIVKVGGSLGKGPGLVPLMKTLVKLGTRHDILVIPGGGLFADAIRDYDRRYGLDSRAAHWMAILAMDQFAHLISSLVPKTCLIRNLKDAQRAREKKLLPVLLTYDLLWEKDDLPNSWDLTSDSIAAWVAIGAKSCRLVLLKSVDGIFAPGKNKFKTQTSEALLKGINIKQLNDSKIVDPYLASLVEKSRLDLWLINGNHPERISQLLDSGVTLGSRLIL